MCIFPEKQMIVRRPYTKLTAQLEVFPSISEASSVNDVSYTRTASGIREDRRLLKTDRNPQNCSSNIILKILKIDAKASSCAVTSSPKKRSTLHDFVYISDRRIRWNTSRNKKNYLQTQPGFDPRARVICEPHWWETRALTTEINACLVCLSVFYSKDIV